MSQYLNDAMNAYVAACTALDAEVTAETLADYAEAWRRLREAANATFGGAAFLLMQGLLDERFEREARAAVIRARKLFDQRFGHHVLLSSKASPRKAGSNDDAVPTR